MLGLFVLFGGYFAVNNHYAQKQQQEMNERQNNLKATGKTEELIQRLNEMLNKTS